MGARVITYCGPCRPCEQGCCCEQVGFEACVMMESVCEEGPYVAEPCKEILGVCFEWNIPACVTGLLQEGETLVYKVFMGDCGTGDAILEVENPSAETCDDCSQFLDRTELFPDTWETCDQCVVDFCLGIYGRTGGTDRLLTTCYSCNDDCDKRCPSESSGSSSSSSGSSGSGSSGSGSGGSGSSGSGGGDGGDSSSSSSSGSSSSGSSGSSSSSSSSGSGGGGSSSSSGDDIGPIYATLTRSGVTTRASLETLRLAGFQSGDEIHLTAGTHTVNGQVLLSDCILQGVGQTTIVRLADYSMSSGFVIGGTGQVSDMTVDVNAKNQDERFAPPEWGTVTGADVGAVGIGGPNAVIDGVRVIHGGTSMIIHGETEVRPEWFGLMCGGTWDESAIINNCLVEEMEDYQHQGVSTAITVHGVTRQGIITNCTVQNIAAFVDANGPSSMHCFTACNGNGFVISNVVCSNITGQAAGVYMDTWTTRGLQILNSTFTAPNGIMLRPGYPPEVKLEDIVVYGCTFNIEPFGWPNPGDQYGVYIVGDISNVHCVESENTFNLVQRIPPTPEIIPIYISDTTPYPSLDWYGVENTMYTPLL